MSRVCWIRELVRERAHAAVEPHRKALCAWALALVTVAAASWPMLQGGGIICDDWGVLRLTSDSPGLLNSYLHWFPLFSNRPLTPLALSAAANVIGFQPHAYVYLQFSLWVVGVSILCAALRRWLPRGWTPLFFTLACLPASASTVLFSPVMQIQCSLALLFAASGLLILETRPFRHGNRAWPYVLFACSLLSYEMFLPLGVFYMASRLEGGTSARERKRPAKLEPVGLAGILRAAAPVGTVVLAIAAYQKVVMPIWMPVSSRLAASSILTMAHGAATWARALAVDTPRMLAGGIVIATARPSVSLALAVVAGAAAATLVGAFRARNGQAGPAGSRPIGGGAAQALVVASAFLTCALLYALSGAHAEVSGYLNRGMTSSWVLLSLLVVVLASRVPRIGSLIVAVFIVASAASIHAQSVNYAESWRLQMAVVESAIASADQAGVQNGAVVLGDVPREVSDSYNGEVVFTRPWDWGGALHLVSGGRFEGGSPLTAADLGQANAVKLSDGTLTLSGWWTASLSGLWFYEFDTRSGIQVMRRCDTPEALSGIVAKVREENLYPTSAPGWAR